MEKAPDCHAGIDFSLTGQHAIGQTAYRSLYLTGRPGPHSNGDRRPVLLLGGTSIAIEDQKELLIYLGKTGLDVASLESPMGGLFDIGINPKSLRLSSLCSFIERLNRVKRIRALDIVAHSYAAYEVVRLLTDAPSTYRPIVRSVLLINPPGFRERIGLASHFLRTIWGHFVCGFVEMNWHRIRWRGGAAVESRPGTRTFARREIHGIYTMSAKSVKNPVRTIREARDIVSYRIDRPMRALCMRYGYDFNLFLNADDRIVPAAVTLRAAKHFLPPGNIRVVPGGHNDILFQEWQRAEFLSFLQEIRGRTPPSIRPLPVSR